MLGCELVGVGVAGELLSLKGLVTTWRDSLFRAWGTLGSSNGATWVGVRFAWAARLEELVDTTVLLGLRSELRIVEGSTVDVIIPVETSRSYSESVSDTVSQLFVADEGARL